MCVCARARARARVCVCVCVCVCGRVCHITVCVEGIKLKDRKSFQTRASLTFTASLLKMHHGCRLQQSPASDVTAVMLSLHGHSKLETARVGSFCS